jgi:hypothetical protein
MRALECGSNPIHCRNALSIVADRSITPPDCKNILQRSYGTLLHLGDPRNETVRQFFSGLWEVHMTSQTIEGACAFAWRNYLLLHNGISENDTRRSALYRYVVNLRDIGEDDFDLLQIAAVAYLKKLDELHDDRSARLAVVQILAERLESRSAQPVT